MITEALPCSRRCATHHVTHGSKQQQVQQPKLARRLGAWSNGSTSSRWSLTSDSQSRCSSWPPVVFDNPQVTVAELAAPVPELVNWVQVPVAETIVLVAPFQIQRADGLASNLASKCSSRQACFHSSTLLPAEPYGTAAFAFGFSWRTLLVRIAMMLIGAPLTGFPLTQA